MVMLGALVFIKDSTRVGNWINPKIVSSDKILFYSIFSLIVTLSGDAVENYSFKVITSSTKIYNFIY